MFMAIVSLIDPNGEETLSLNTGPAEIESINDAIGTSLGVFEEEIAKGDFQRLSITITKFGE